MFLFHGGFSQIYYKFVAQVTVRMALVFTDACRKKAAVWSHTAALFLVGLP